MQSGQESRGQDGHAFNGWPGFCKDGEMITAASSDFIQSLARGLEVIRTFDRDHPTMSVSEVATRAAMTRASARRFLLTLESLGYVSFDGRQFALTPQVLNLGYSFLSALSLPELIRPHLDELARELDESVAIAILDRTEIVLVAQVGTRRIIGVRDFIGARYPAYATAMGRVLLAGLSMEDLNDVLKKSDLLPLTKKTLTEPAELYAEIDTVRSQGWGIVDGELESGLRSLAVPVHDREGRTMAAMNVSLGTTPDDLDQIIARYLPALKLTAQKFEAETRFI